MERIALERQRARRRRMALWTGLIGFVLVVLLGLSLLLGLDVYARASALQRAVGDLQTDMSARNLTAAAQSLERAQTELVGMERAVSPLRALMWVPGLGDQIEAGFSILDDGIETLEIAQDLFAIALNVESDVELVGLAGGFTDIVSYQDLDPEVRREIARSLRRAVPELERAESRVALAVRDLEALPDQGLFVGLQALRTEMLARLRGLDSALQIVVPVAQILPEVGGFEGEQHYLVLLQNNAELRPTGGFWGTYGVLTLKDGEIVDIQTDDIYAVDGPAEGQVTTTPPAALQRYLGSDVWYLRDANWSPDVPTSVRRAFTFYDAQTQIEADPERPVTAPRVAFDGAILLTPEVGEVLLEIYGDVQIRDVLFTPETFFDVLEYEVEQAFVDRGTLVEDRKDIIGELVDILFDRLTHATPDQLEQSATAAIALLNEQDIMVFSQDAEVQRVFEKKGWAGELRVTSTRDHFMVVDANLAALKTDAYISRAYTYAIHEDIDGDLIANLQISYDHLGGFDYRTTRYRTYTRVYVPFGSELIRADGALLDDALKNPRGVAGSVDVGQEFGATVFGAFTSVEPQATGQLSFVYKLPERIKELVASGTYILDVQRQVGVEDAALNLDLSFGEPIKSAEPAEISEYWFDDRYTVTTRAVPYQQFRVSF